MSDFLKKLKGIFVVEAPAGEAASDTTAPEKQAEAPTNVSVQIPQGKASDKFYDILLGAMEANNQEGFDYLEFKKSLKTLAQMPMDEKTRYLSAFAAAQAMGITPQKLSESAGFYLKVLQTEDSKFLESVNAQRQKQIGNKEKAIADMDATIKAKGEQIAKLTLEIQEHQADMEKMKAEISDAVVKIETTLSDFHATYSELTAQISKDVDNMTKYLKQ
ncbi:hypothetical protein [Emticicia fluvialis]|uniref:hypothetical protein n=1 Tax=Emticicia fluvialis TaxID=2974474 RepID=UPI0021658D22|nr:hypothetical protein [Emticicia fluvialis]